MRDSDGRWHAGMGPEPKGNLHITVSSAQPAVPARLARGDGPAYATDILSLLSDRFMADMALDEAALLGVPTGRTLTRRERILGWFRRHRDAFERARAAWRDE